MSAAPAPKPKSHLVAAAEREDRSKALISGYLRKKNSGGRWQKRWFEAVGHYFVYYKKHDSADMLCAMDLWKAQRPELVPGSTGTESCEFSIHWDKHRLFRAPTPKDAVAWVECLRKIQQTRPAAAPGGLAAGAGAGVGAPGSEVEMAATSTRPSESPGAALKRDTPAKPGCCASCVIS